MDANPTSPSETVSRLLMLSHVLPVNGVSEAHDRAARLLSIVSGRYRVHLAAMADVPLKLDRWRELRGSVERLDLESPGSLGRWFGSGLRRAARGFLHLTRRDEPLPRFDYVLCTHAGLVRAAERFDAATRVCDCTNDAQLADLCRFDGVLTRTPQQRAALLELATHAAVWPDAQFVDPELTLTRLQPVARDVVARIHAGRRAA